MAFAVELRHFLVAVSCQTTHFLVAAGGHLRARNSMARTKGATDKGERRRRKSTKVELDARAHKKAEEAERKRAREHAAAAGAKRKFLRGMQPTAVGNGEAADEHGTRHESSGGASADDRDRGVADGDSRSSGAGGAGSNGTHPRRGEDDAEEQTERQAERQEARPADVEAELDDEDQLEGSDGVTSVMGAYLKAVFERLHSETIGEASRNALEAKWLLDMLNEEGANFWLPAARARSVCTKLGLEYGEPAYYRDIKVWLPDEQWGPEAMPPCVVCGSAKEVGVHAFADNHFGRRISSVCGHYFVMTRRYKCHCCERKAKAAKLAAEAAGLRVEVDEETDASRPQFTFRGYDARSRAQLPHGYNDDFPAFLTHRAGVDMEIVDLMRPLYDKGLRPEALSATLLELQTKAYTKAYERREHRLKRDRRAQPGLAAEMFSEFGDKSKYAGLVPSGRYLSTVYEQYEDSISDHLDKEVKKRGARRLHWDASYKEAKHLGRYHGESIFKALITATNEVAACTQLTCTQPPPPHTHAQHTCTHHVAAHTYFRSLCFRSLGFT